MIKIKTFVFNPFQENTYVLHDDSNKGIIIDPGCWQNDEETELSEYIESNELEIVAVYNTHCHIDHILGNYYCKEKYSCPLIIPKNEVNVFRAGKVYASTYGIHNYSEAEFDSTIDEGDTIEFGNTVLQIMYIPGHAPGHLVFTIQMIR